VLLAFSLLPCLAEPPTAKAGPYTVSIESVARVMDFTQPPESRAFTLINLQIEGAAEVLGRVLEAVQEPAASDDQKNQLALCQVLFPGRTPPAEGRRPAVKMAVQVWFSAASRAATALAAFSAHVVCYEKKDSLRVDFLSVAGEKPSPQALDGLLIAADFLGPQESPSGKVYQVKVEVKVLPEKPDPSVQWANEQVELIDAEGQPRAALSTSRSYQYDESGRIIARTISAAFAFFQQPPRGLRYRVDRLRGVQTFPYHFENLPLP